MTTTVSQLMTRSPQTCSPEGSLNDAAQRMWEHDIGSVAVVDQDGRLIGMLTDRDIAMAAYTQGKPLRDISVGNAMSQRVHFVRETASVGDAEEMMAHYQIRRIPVVDGQNRMIGLLSLNDLARHCSTGRRAVVDAQSVAATLRAVGAPRSGGRHVAAAE